MEIVRNGVKKDFIKVDNIDKVFKQQSKLIFNGIHKPYTNCDSYTFKPNEAFMNKPFFIGFAVLELLITYET